MNIIELREKSAVLLIAELLKLKEDQFKLRMRKSTGQLAQTHLLKQNKKDIARVKMLLAQKESGK